MKVSDFKYELPEELIAQVPIEKRDESRLMILDREKQTIEHKTFKDIKEKILSILKIDKNDRFCPKWLKDDDSEYINVHSKFNIPCQLLIKDNKLVDIDMETELFEGAEVLLAIKVKEGGVYPHAIRVLKNGEPFNPFECFDN